uniref:Uncharacterized protein n=1 Tax=Daphnia magna TaxID=35525 RepID=A0A0N8BCT8_9CRUS
MFLYYYVNLCHSFFPSPFFFSLLGHRSNEKRLLESFKFFFFSPPHPPGTTAAKNEEKKNKNKKKQTTFVHHLKNTLFSAFGTENIGAIGDESFSDQRHVAASALEAIIMPMAVLERDKSCAANTGNGLGASSATLSEQFSETFSAIGFLILGSEPLAGQRLVAVSARKAFTMPGIVLVSHTASRDDLGAFDAASCEFFLVTPGTVDILFARDERLGADRRLAHEAAEALLVPLSTLVFHFFGSGAEDFATSVAASGVHRVVARAAKDLVGLGAELLVDQRQAALVAQEAGFVPMTILVRQILRINADDSIAIVTVVGEDGLVALDAVRMFVAQNVTLPSQRLVALPATEVAQMPILRHGFRVFSVLRLLVRFQSNGLAATNVAVGELALLHSGGGAGRSVRIGLNLLHCHFFHLLDFLVTNDIRFVIGHFEWCPRFCFSFNFKI